MVVTSRAGAKHRDRAMKEGAAAFLTKPVAGRSADRGSGTTYGNGGDASDDSRGVDEHDTQSEQKNSAC